MTQIEVSAGSGPVIEVERRRQILDAATDLFLEFGYEGGTLDMLIERIGGSRRTIYNLFGSKEGLLEAIVTERCVCLYQDIKSLSFEGLAPRDTLEKLAIATLRTIMSPGGVKLFRLVVQESARNPHLGRMLYEKGVALSNDILADYLKRETRAGRLRSRAICFLSLCFGDLKPLPKHISNNSRNAPSTCF
jgi:AcrR family transcriptional regulator